MKNKIGRPKKDGAIRGRPFSFRMLPAEEQQFRDTAEREHLSLSAWMRQALLRAVDAAKRR